MTQMTPEEIKQVIQKIENKFIEAKSNCRKFYKEIDTAKTEEKCNELIGYYKQMIEALEYIKNESFILDSIEIPVEWLHTDDNITELRKRNCNIIQSLAQHIRGCVKAFEDYNNKII